MKKDEIKIKIKNFTKLKGKTLKLYWSNGTSKSATIDSEEITVSDVYIGKAFIGIWDNGASSEYGNKDIVSWKKTKKGYEKSVK